MAGMDWGAMLGPRGLEAPGYQELLAKLKAERAERLANPHEHPEPKPKPKGKGKR
jgi:hypothetical protein